MSPDTDSESATLYCTDCGKDISADTNFCPKCGAEQGSTTIEEIEDHADSTDEKKSGFKNKIPGLSKKNTTRRNVLIGGGYAIGGLMLLGTVAGDSADGGGSEGSSDDTSGGSSVGDNNAGLESEYPNAWAIDETNEIVLQDVEASVGEFSVEITGIATNASDNDYNYVQLSFGLYDNADVKVGDAFANTSGLASGQRWRFEAIGTQTEDVESFRIENITAY